MKRRLVFACAFSVVLGADFGALAQEAGTAAANTSGECTCHATHAEPSATVHRENNVAFFPIAGALGGVGVGYSRGFLNWFTAGARFAYAPPFLHPYHFIDGELSLFAWPRHAHDGLFIGPRLSLGRTISTNDRATGTTLLVVGLVGGWQWLWDNGVNAAAGVGFQRVYNVSQHDGCPDWVNCGASFDPSPENNVFGRLSVGYAF